MSGRFAILTLVARSPSMILLLVFSPGRTVIRCDTTTIATSDIYAVTISFPLVHASFKLHWSLLLLNRRKWFFSRHSPCPFGDYNVHSVGWTWQISCLYNVLFLFEVLPTLVIAFIMHFYDCIVFVPRHCKRLFFSIPNKNTTFRTWRVLSSTLHSLHHFRFNASINQLCKRKYRNN